jgi:hypothetical protein
MSGSEIAVIGELLAVISAFKDGKSIFEIWRSQRKARSDAAAEELDISLSQGPSKLKIEHDKMLRPLGPAFAQGDGMNSDAILRLKTNMIRSTTTSALPSSFSISA